MTTGVRSPRRHNLALVLSVLSAQGPTSRATLAATTGLTKATVSSLVDELTARRLVREAAAPPRVRPAPVGRPGTLVEVADVVVGIGAAVEVDALTVCAADIAGNVVAERSRDVDNAARPPAVTIAHLRRLLREMGTSLRRRGRLALDPVVAVPGLVRAGTVLVAPNLGWRDVPLAAELAPTRPVVVDNEANLVALAELRLGQPVGPTFVAVSGGVGVGAGVVLDGRLWRGAHGFGGELGHFVVDAGGRPCSCGNRGCLETIAGKAALRRAGDGPDAMAAVAGALGAALAPAVSLLDPDGVVLGGTLAPLAPAIAPAVREVLRDRVLGGRFSPCEVTASTLGPRAAARGAAIASAQAVLADPTRVPAA